MAAQVERIQIILSAMTKRFAKQMDFATAKMKMASKGMKGWQNVMKMGFPAWSAMEKATRLSTRQFDSFIKTLDPAVLDEFGLALSSNGKRIFSYTEGTINAGRAQEMMVSRVAESGGKFAHTFKKMTHGAKGFKMEMLGVMFFGMMMQKTFSGLLQPAMEVYGVFNLFRIMLMMLFLPVVSLIYPILSAIMFAFMNLSPEVKLMIGVLTILGVVIGTLLFAIGALALGLGSLTVFAGGFLLPAALIIAAIIAIIAILALLFLAWETNFLGIRDILTDVWEGLSAVFATVMDAIKLTLDTAWGFIEPIFNTWENYMGKLGEVNEVWQSIMETVFNAAKLVVDMFWGFMLGFFEGMGLDIEDLQKIIEVLRDVWAKVWDKISQAIDWAWVTFIKPVLDAITPALDEVNKILQTFIDLSKGAGKFVGGLVKGGINLVTGGAFNDFIWRPGSKPIAFSPQDTLIGTKGGTPSGGSVVHLYYSPVINIPLEVREEVDRDKLLRDIDDHIVKEVRGMVQ